MYVQQEMPFTASPWSKIYLFLYLMRYSLKTQIRVLQRLKRGVMFETSEEEVFCSKEQRTADTVGKVYAEKPHALQNRIFRSLLNV